MALSHDDVTIGIWIIMLVKLRRSQLCGLYTRSKLGYRSIYRPKVSNGHYGTPIGSHTLPVKCNRRCAAPKVPKSSLVAPTLDMAIRLLGGLYTHIRVWL